MVVGYMYILKCNDDTFYTGSTTNLTQRFSDHQLGIGANYTLKRLPVTLFHFEEFSRIDLAFKREKQVQNWSRKKKEALALKDYKELQKLAICQNDSHYSNKGIFRTSEENEFPLIPELAEPNRSPSGAEGPHVEF